MDNPPVDSSVNVSPFLPRAASRIFGRLLDALPVVVVTGPRQAGKSTFVQLAPQLAGRPYATLDDATTARRAREAPEAFVQSAPFLTMKCSAIPT